jgi:hypothetical protein
MDILIVSENTPICKYVNNIICKQPNQIMLQKEAIPQGGRQILSREKFEDRPMSPVSHILFKPIG